MILLAYDRSIDAAAAIERLAILHPGAEIAVTTAWRRFAGAPGHRRSGAPAGDFWTDAAARRVDAERREASFCRAAVGAEDARAHGLIAHPRSDGDAAGEAAAIIAAADDLDAELIVMGTHGRSGTRLHPVGDVVDDVRRGTDRPVLAVSAPADRRRGSSPPPRRPTVRTPDLVLARTAVERWTTDGGALAVEGIGARAVAGT